MKNYSLLTRHPFETESPICPLRQCNMESHHENIGSGWDFEYHTTFKDLQFVQCQICDLIFPTEIPCKSAMPSIYPDSYYSFSETKKSNPLVQLIRSWVTRRKAIFYKNLVNNPSAQVLDVGCGDGRLIEILKYSCPPDWRYAGIDWNEDAIHVLIRRGDLGRSGDVSTMELTDWEGRFDLIVMHQLIEHVHDPRLLLSKMGRLLKPGGIISIETPDVESWDFKLLHRRYWSVYHIPRHFYIFNKNNFTEMANALGFEVLSTKSLINPVAWIHSIKSYCEDVPLLRPIASFFHHQNPIMLAIFTPLEILQTTLTKSSSNMQINLRKDS
jgi:2-polyprenyl-3-methyl-5-hydroxy-6-metoxy-1,4-benzoquinol methylase